MKIIIGNQKLCLESIQEKGEICKSGTENHRVLGGPGEGQSGEGKCRGARIPQGCAPHEQKIRQTRSW